tara:strand:- start:158 stop:325 length:168 start_codon:yes stop_codon:yes gene_type:complete
MNSLNENIIENNNIEDNNINEYNKEISYEDGYKIIRSMDNRRGSLRVYKTRDKYK